MGRFLFENYNSLSLWENHNKIHRLNKLIKEFDADCIAGVELQVQWSKMGKDSSLARLLAPGKDKKVCVGYNRHEDYSRSQYGGTSLVSLGRLSQFVKSADTDPHGLGRWSWFHLSHGSKSTRVISAYVPCRSKASSTSSSQRRETVYNQHRRYFRQFGDKRCPRTIMVEHLAEQIALWKRDGDEIVLFVDANSDVYDGILARRLAQDDVRMKDVCEELLGHRSPNSHQSGSLPISGIFTTQGVACSAVFESAHGFGLGDHRLFAIDIDLTSLIESDFPQVVRQPGRKLQAKKYRRRRQYNASLRKNFARHNLTAKYRALLQQRHLLTTEELQAKLDQLDRIESELMICAESKCSTRRSGKICFSPQVGKWINALRLFKRIRSHKVKPLDDPRNLYRRCTSFTNNGHAVKQPCEYSLAEVEAQIKAIEKEIDRLKFEAPEMRLQHLYRCREEAEAKGLAPKVKAITEIINQEAMRGRYSEMKKTTNKKRSGGKVFSVETENDDGTRTQHTTQEAISKVAGQTIGERYRLAFSAPIMSNPELIRSVGLTGNGPDVDAILNGTFEFPPGTDEYTKLLMLEAAVIFCSIGGEQIEDWVTRDDFQQFWLHAREATESSKSGRHFGHYKSAAHDNTLSQHHATRLNTIHELGITPTRWKSSLTVLLEKVFGVRLITKLRAICLLEADFNWLNKLIFAHRLEQHCRKHDIIPAEQFAKSKSCCEEAALTKNLVLDTNRILHNSMAIVGADLDQCFDRGNGAVAGIASRAHGVSKKSTHLMLSTMQLMQYFVKSGFGVSKEPAFGGSPDDILMGFGQGSGAAPHGMRNIVTLAINAYKRLGHGMNTRYSISDRIFMLAALLYVDDTDKLHWSDIYGISDEEFLADVQSATTDWGMLIQATGGAIKQSKSFYYLLSWKFSKGVPMLKPLTQLPSTPITIPQTDGSAVSISHKDAGESMVTLGVHTNCLNDPTDGLNHIKSTGLDWVDCLRARPLERRDTLLSLQCQQYSKWSYGLSSLYATPEQLDATAGSIYFQALPFLGFNRNITKEYRTIPRDFQGIGLRHWSIEKLSKDLSVLIRHWQSSTTLGKALQFLFEAFLMEVGLDGNVFSRPFSQFQHLASHSWFKILWQYASLYKLTIQFGTKFLLQPTRQGDISLADLFITFGLPIATQVHLHRVRRFLCVHSLSDLLQEDGRTFNEAAFGRRPFPSSRKFSWEQPTSSDFDLWSRTLKVVVQDYFSSHPPLGQYLSRPHIQRSWFVSDDGTQVFHTFPGGYDVFSRTDSGRTTRSGSPFNKISTLPGLPPSTNYASITNYTSNGLRLHSSSPSYQPISRNKSFLDCLHSISNTSLWENLIVDSDGSWLYPSLVQGSLMVCNDGSYMKHLSKTTCSGAFILRCTMSGKEISGCFVDESEDASNYRGELLGALGPLLIIRAATESRPSNSHLPSEIQLHCDNKGVLNHGNDPTGYIKADQQQADLVQLLKCYSRQIPTKITWIHVRGHADKHKAYSQLTDIEQLNVRCDTIAKKVLIDSVSSQSYILPDFPDEDIVIRLQNNKVRSSLRTAIYKTWGRQAARSLLHRRDKLHRNHFDLVYWDIMPRVSSFFPPTFLDWRTRHISDFNGCNRYLSRFRKSVKNYCPSCGRCNEDTKHITRCSDPVRTKLYLEGVNLLIQHLQNNHTPTDVCRIFQIYLRDRGNTLMSSLVHPSSPMYCFAKCQDAIGFDNLLVGQLPRTLISYMTPILRKASKRGISVDLWAKNFAVELLLFTHRQWTYRNSVVHYKPSEGKTVSEHEMVDAHVRSLMTLSPSELPSQHRHLLTKENFQRLGAGSTTNKQFWIAEIQSALAEAAITKRLKRKKYKRTRIRIKHNNTYIHTTSTVTPLQPPKLPSEKGLKWKKKRQK